MTTDAPSSSVASPPTCAHCSLPVPAGLVRPAEPLQFCCSGCRTVAETLGANGLDARYYALRSEFSQGERAAPTRATGRSFTAFDRDQFHSEHVRVDAATSQASVDFLLEGVHCAACVWLVERLARFLPGVTSTRLRLRESRVRVAFDPAQVKVSEIAEALDRLGYPPHPARAGAEDDVRRSQQRRHLIAIGVAGVCAGNAMLVAFALYSAEEGTLDPTYRRLFEGIGLVLGWLSILWPGRTFLAGARSAIRTRTGHLDLPIAIALLAGALGGTWNTFAGGGGAYFDSLTVLVFLLLVGRFVQARQQRWAADAVDLTRALTPSTCRVIERDGQIVEITTPELALGQTTVVRAGETFPADGTLLTDRARVDLSLLSGESLPQSLTCGASIHAGSVNVSAEAHVRVTALLEASRAGRIMGLVRDGLDAKPIIQRITDRLAARFVAVVCALATITFAVWTQRAGVAVATDTTVALLIVACPCALGLATPLALAVAVGTAARRGILVKDASVLERLDGEASLILDKTGTLTHGRLHVTEVLGDQSVLAAVAAIESRSGHPVAAAVARDLRLSSSAPASNATDVAEHLSGGITGCVDDRVLRIGSIRFLESHGHQRTHALRSSLETLSALGRSIVVVAPIDIQGQPGPICTAIGLADTAREGTREIVAQLAASGWQPEILSGDHAGAVAQLADEISVDVARGETDPEGKLARVQELRKLDRRVVMVGDGVNDAAALAAADVGIAVHGGAEASLAAADVYVGVPGLAPIVTLRRIARRTMRTIHVCLGVSIAYNAAGVTLAALGYVDPLVAAVLMPVSSLTVLSIAFLPVAFAGWSGANPKQR